MTTNSSNAQNAANENPEALRARQERIRKRLLGEVLEARIKRRAETDGVAYYDRVKSERDYATVKQSMRDYMRDTSAEDLEEELRDIEPADMNELIDGIAVEDVRQELLKYGAPIESDRDTVFGLIKKEYSLDRGELEAAHAFVGSADYSTLKKLKKNRVSRKKALEAGLGVALDAKEKETANVLEELGVKRVRQPLKQADKDMLARLTSPDPAHAFVSAEQVKRLFELLELNKKEERTPKMRGLVRKLFSRFLPFITVGELRHSGLMKRSDVTTLVLNHLRTLRSTPEDGLESFTAKLGLTAREIQRYDRIAVPITLMPDEVLDDLFDREDSPLYEEVARELTAEKRQLAGLDDPDEDEEKEDEHGDEHYWLVEEDEELKWPRVAGLYESLHSKGVLRERLVERIRKLRKNISHPEKLDDDSFIALKYRNPETDKTEQLYAQIHELYAGGQAEPLIRLRNRGVLDAVDMGSSNSVVEEISYNDFVDYLGAFESGEVMSREEMDRKIASGEIADYVPEEDVRTVSQLVRHLNEIDKERSVTDLRAGMSFDFGDPRQQTEDSGGSEGPKYEVFTVTAINETESRLSITNGFGTTMLMTFSEFLQAFQESKAKRFTHSMREAEGVIANMADFAAAGKDVWKRMAFEDGEFVEEGGSATGDGKRRHRYFRGGDTVVEVLEASPGEITFLRHDDYKEWDSTKGKKPSAKKTWRYEKVGYEKFYQILRSADCVPSVLDYEFPDEPLHFDLEEEGSGLMHFFKDGLRISHIIGAFKQGADFFKHEFEHGDSYKSAKLLSMFAKYLPVSAEAKLMLKGTLQGEIEKIVEHTTDLLTKSMSGLDRRKLTKDMLLSKHTKQAELMGAMLVTLEKGGGMLYAEAPLSELEGTGIWFKRLAGLPINMDHTRHPKWIEYAQEAMDFRDTDAGKQMNLTGKITEIEVIWTWARKVEKDGDATFIPNFGPRVLRMWNEGRNAETEKGKKEADNYGDPKKRLTYALNKAKDGLWYCSFGDYIKSSDGAAMQSLINKGGDAHTNGALPFIAVMGNMSKMVPIGVFNRARVNMAMAGKHTYAPFMFMKTHEDLALFRRVTEKIVEMSGNARAIELSRKIKHLRDEHREATYRGEPVNKLLVDMSNELWSELGKDIGLMEKLNIFRDRTILARRHEDPDFDMYVKRMEGFYGDPEWTAQDGANASERQNGVYEGNHTPPRVDVMTRWLRFDSHAGGTLTTDSNKIWEQLLTHLDMLKTMRDPRAAKDASESVHELYRKKLFAEYQHAICAMIMSEQNQLKDEACYQDYAQTLINQYGFDETLLVPKNFRMGKNRKRDYKEDIKVIDFDQKNYAYAEDGTYDEYVDSTKTNAIEKRTFAERFDIFMGRAERGRAKTAASFSEIGEANKARVDRSLNHQPEVEESHGGH